MLRLPLLVPVLLLVALASMGCDGAGDERDSRPSMDEVLASLGELPEVERVVRLTERNDVEELLGKPRGYDHAAVLVDSRLTCDGPGVECGALLEVWDDAHEARARSEYVTALLDSGVPGLGREHHFLDGPLLLRVTGHLGRSAVAEYAAAFGA